MKRSTKRDIAISCFVLALGCFVMAAGWGMGGSLTTGRSISIGGSNGVQIGSSGIFVGGRNGVYVGPYGISIGGRNGIYVGPDGIRVGASGAYSEAETTADLIDQVWIQSGIESDWGTTVYEDDMIVQNMEVEAFDALEVDIDLGDITVFQGGDGYFVEFRNNIEGYELFYHNGTTLTVGSKDQRKHLWNNVDNARAAVTIIIPEGAALNRINLHTSLGDISVGELDSKVERADLDTELGDVLWWGGFAKELRAESSLGDVTVVLPEDATAEYNLSTSLGEVYVNGAAMKKAASSTPRYADCAVEAHSDLGDVGLSVGK